MLVILTLDVTNKRIVENKRTIIISNLMSCNKIFRELLPTKTEESSDIKENNGLGIINLQNHQDQLSLLKMVSTSIVYHHQNLREIPGKTLWRSKRDT